MSYTPEQLRICADAMEAHDQGKPVECSNDGIHWLSAGVPLWNIEGGVFYRPKPEPKTVPWSAITIPIGKIVTRMAHGIPLKQLIVGVDGDIIHLAIDKEISAQKLLNDYRLDDGSLCGDAK